MKIKNTYLFFRVRVWTAVSDNSQHYHSYTNNLTRFSLKRKIVYVLNDLSYRWQNVHALGNEGLDEEVYHHVADK